MGVRFGVNHFSWDYAILSAEAKDNCVVVRKTINLFAFNNLFVSIFTSLILEIQLSKFCKQNKCDSHAFWFEIHAMSILLFCSIFVLFL